MPLRENRILFVGNVGAGDIFAAEYDFGMLITGAAFGSDQIIEAVLLKNMRRFDPYRLFAEIDAAIDEQHFIANHFQIGDIKLIHSNGTMAIVQRLVIRRNAVVNDIGFTIFIKKHRRIDAVDLRYPNRIRPRPCGFFRGDEEVAALVNQRAGHIKHAVMMANRGRKDAARNAEAVQIQLLRPVHHMPNLPPIYQILAVKNRNAGEIGE
ncbi:MAG: hypothetical protein ALAOOOJD_02357 [bacterium]|nr:hypothetical protein [bacterium]